MLTSLYIKNLAVVKELQIDFEKGLTVLTGETGAGKSILIDAFFVILGTRASKELIRKDEASLLAEASFYFEYYDKSSIIADYVSDNSLIISREVFRDGRNVIKINGRTGNNTILRELAPYLISIHSQNDNQRLFNPEKHYSYLDIYGGTTELYEKYSAIYNERLEIKNELLKAKESVIKDQNQIEYLKLLKKEIEDADIKENEEEELKEIKKNMKEARAVSDSAAIAAGALFENESSAYNLIGEAVEAVKRFDAFSEYAEKLADIKESVAEISELILDKYKLLNEELNEKYRDINQLEERLNEIYVIKTRYGGSVAAALERLKNANEELYKLENSENIISELNLALSEKENELHTVAKELSEKRQKNALFLSKAVEYELHELMMPNAKFSVNIEKTDEFTKSGAEKIEFLFSANAGMGLLPLCKIASGGEISRVNLAIKSILYNIDPACAFVFDEIDVGISGRAAQKTAEKMYGISSGNQVLCVTHLPQIAAMADNHLLITKNEDNGETKTHVKKIEGSERVKEIARIISGVSLTELTLKNAEETLLLAQKFKNEKS